MNMTHDNTPLTDLNTAPNTRRLDNTLSPDVDIVKNPDRVECKRALVDLPRGPEDRALADEAVPPHANDNIAARLGAAEVTADDGAWWSAPSS